MCLCMCMYVHACAFVRVFTCVHVCLGVFGCVLDGGG